jgi:eukaryotic-like serine/threonine-protein kinase
VTDEGDLIAGRYRLISRLGAGAMGVVWQAQDERLHRTVAIKQLLLAPGLSHIDADEANRRAMREGRITARLHHPHAIAVYDVAEHAGQPCLVMEYLPSRSLATVLSIDGELGPGIVAKIGSQIAAALAAAHQAGIVHRDIKPGNVLLTGDGTAKITDFGISHAVGDVTVTATGILAGTPAYLAPEVARGASAGFPSDVFSLGSTLYTALEGTPPFGLHDNAIAQLHQVAAGDIIPPRQSGPLAPVLLRLLQRDPEERPAMDEVRDALASLAVTLVGPADGRPLRTLTLSRNDPPATRAPRAQQTLTPSAQPSDETITQSEPTTVNARAGRFSAERDGNGWRKRWRFLVGAVAVMLLAGGLLAIGLVNYGRVGGDIAATPSSTSGNPARSLPVPPGQSDPGQSGTGQENTTTVPGGLPDTPERPQRAITDYYAMIPDDLSTAWQRLTPKYQQNHAGGFTGYQNFWNPVQRVTVSDVTASQDGAVDATIDYFFKDGRVVEEQTSYGLVAEEGQWKIDSSTVRSSQTKQGS